MLEHEVEKLLGELRPEGLPADGDAKILAAIREADAGLKSDAQTITLLRRPLPAWAAAAACLVVGVSSWMAGAHTTRSSSDAHAPVEPAPHSTETTRSAAKRVHVETNVFAATPRRVLDVHNWSPRAGATLENRS